MFLDDRMSYEGAAVYAFAQRGTLIIYTEVSWTKLKTGRRGRQCTPKHLDMGSWRTYRGQWLPKEVFVWTNPYLR